METSPRRSSVTRTTKESKDVEVPPCHFKNNVAPVSPSAEGDRRSVDSAVEAYRPLFYFDADDDGRQGTKATMTCSERTRLTSTRVNGSVTAGRTLVAKLKCDVIVTEKYAYKLNDYFLCKHLTVA